MHEKLQNLYQYTKQRLRTISQIRGRCHFFQFCQNYSSWWKRASNGSVSKHVQGFWYHWSQYTTKELECYGFKGKALNWFRGYLTKRKQFVHQRARLVRYYGLSDIQIVTSSMFTSLRFILTANSIIISLILTCF